jgi:hypothetical protein
MQLAARSSIMPFVALALACGGTSTPTPVTRPSPDSHPLAALVASGAIVTPTYALTVAPDLSWSAGNARDVLRAVDDDIAAALTERGLKRGWILPADLAASYKRNPTYASDPYALAEEPLRAPTFNAGSRLTEPLASQLRTMIALQENARAVLSPIELRLERTDATAGRSRATLRLALIDPRFSEARWVGDVRIDTTGTDVRVFTRALAARAADLIVSR